MGKKFKCCFLTLGDVKYIIVIFFALRVSAEIEILFWL